MQVRSRLTFMALGALIHRDLALVTHRGRRCKLATRRHARLAASVPQIRRTVDQDRLTLIAACNPTPVVSEVLRFENLPPESTGSRRAVVRWSDGAESEALRWYVDEVLICEGDLIGKTREQLRSLHFRRDRNWLQS